MPTPCIFCDNNSGSREHLWPQWVHQRKDFGPLRHKRGKVDIIIPNPKITVKCVCGSCNNGWMSKLESANIPLIGCMMQDVAIQLDSDQQKTVATWCMKIAFLTDWTRAGGRLKKFYTAEEGAAFAKGFAIPPRTRIWIGHMTSPHLTTDGHDLALLSRTDGTRFGTASVVTLAVGHFAAQVVTDRPLPEYDRMDFPASRPIPGPWAAKLIRLWPPERDWVVWPPKASFTNGGPEGVGYLMHRLRIGQQVDKIGS